MKHPAWWLVAALIAGAAWALDPPRPAPSPQAAEEAPVEAPPPAGEPLPETAPAAPDAEEPDAADPQAAEDALPPAPEPRSTGPTPQRFDPSEKVRADFPVSFPIDI